MLGDRGECSDSSGPMTSHWLEGSSDLGAESNPKETERSSQLVAAANQSRQTVSQSGGQRDGLLLGSAGSPFRSAVRPVGR